MFQKQREIAIVYGSYFSLKLNFTELIVAEISVKPYVGLEKFLMFVFLSALGVTR